MFLNHNLCKYINYAVGSSRNTGLPGRFCRPWRGQYTNCTKSAVDDPYSRRPVLRLLFWAELVQLVYSQRLLPPWTTLCRFGGVDVARHFPAPVCHSPSFCGTRRSSCLPPSPPHPPPGFYLVGLALPLIPRKFWLPASIEGVSARNCTPILMSSAPALSSSPGSAPSSLSNG
ncbi:hypothetical protein Naga_100231g10 [Nannochloropsis gaditana]|uniref:Uncharacterized protein n=1 Tax=Nannochloropsis gaditana TaxID=72520 RepID=W7TME8_9STRA|nr:hypothetical protein Naga_100231g10 [Nannochloropsis gaditana]